MKITDIKVFPVREEKLKAFISIVLDECFMVNDIKVIQGKEGFFISMPSRRKRNGKFKDVAHPLNNKTRQSMEREILAAYEATLDGADGADGAEEQQIKVKARPTGSGEGRKRRDIERSRRRGGRAGGREPGSAEPRGSSVPPPERREEPAAPAAQTGAASGTMGAAPATAATEAAEVAEVAEQPVADASRENHTDSGLEQEQTDKSPDEVAEHHLRDSFWGT